MRRIRFLKPAGWTSTTFPVYPGSREFYSAILTPRAPKLDPFGWLSRLLSRRGGTASESLNNVSVRVTDGPQSYGPDADEGFCAAEQHETGAFYTLVFQSSDHVLFESANRQICESLQVLR